MSGGQDRRPVPGDLDRSLAVAAQNRLLADLEFAQDAVVDPVLVPPFAGVDLHAVDLHAEMNVDAFGEAG